jgi:DNA-binding PadR family transcriptional regulator
VDDDFRRRRRRRRDFWRAWRDEMHKHWSEYGDHPWEMGPPPEVLHAWREFFHSYMGEWPENHWAFGGRRFSPWHQGIDAFNPFVANLLSKGGGLLPLVVMVLLDANPRYGNEIMSMITELTRGQWVANPGAIYPLMTMLEAQGLVEGEWEDPDKRTIRIYRLTGPGRQELARLKAVVRPKLIEAVEVLQRLADNLDERGDDAPGDAEGSVDG